MTSSTPTIRELADASRSLEDAELTVRPDIQDRLSDDIRAVLRHTDGLKASEIALRLFGDMNNAHVLAVSRRLVLMRDALEVVWSDGVYTLSTEAEEFTLDDVRRVLETCEVDGGETDEEVGDSVQLCSPAGVCVTIYLDVSVGDRLPTDEEIVEHAESMGVWPWGDIRFMPHRWDAAPVRR